MLLTLSLVLIIHALLPIYCFSSERSCHNFFINNEKFECPNGSVYIASEERCVDVTKFNCQKNSWNVVEYLPDPYLCSVHHVCLNGEEVGRICCSPRQIFSLELQSCIELTEISENDCSSDPCASKFLNKTCSFTYESKAVSYDVPECPTSRAEREQPTLRREESNNFWREEKAAEPSCDGLNNFNTFCQNCATAVFCYGPTNETIQAYPTTCDSGSACLLADCAILSTDSECACTGNSGVIYKEDPYSDESYITCVDETPVYITCESGTVADVTTGTCIIPPVTIEPSPTMEAPTTITVSTTAPKPCTAPGTFKLSCTEYQVCSGNGATPIYGKCPAEHFYDLNTNKCIYGYNFTCTTSGSYPDPYDCRRSYICNNAVLIATSCCSATTHLDNATQTCLAPSCQSNYECKPGAIPSVTTPIPTGAPTNPLTTGSPMTTHISPDSPTTALSTDSPKTTAITSTTSASSPVSPSPDGDCMQSDEGQYFYDPYNPKRYYQCQNEVLVPYECPGKTFYDCIYLYCTLPEYISGCPGIPTV